MISIARGNRAGLEVDGPVDLAPLEPTLMDAS